MRRRPIRLLVILACLAALLPALRADLASLAAHQGSARLRAGDVTTAEAAFTYAVKLGSDAAALSYNLGVIRYQKGDFARAQRHFDAAIASAEPSLLAAAHYNRGNSLVRQAGQLPVQERQAATILLQRALADYKRTLALVPGAADARHNLALVQTRLNTLATAPSRPEHPGGADNDQRRSTTAASLQASAPRAEARAAAGNQAPAGQPADGPDTGAIEPSREALTHAEATQLLNDVRGRERPLGLLRDDRAPGRSAAPDRDW